MRCLRWSVALLLSLLGAAQAQNMTPGADPGGATTPGTGTVYYVSSSDGSNGNSGTSIGSPWQTITKVNDTAFNPGDTVLFKRGDTFPANSFLMDRSGNSSNPIIFGAYGTGARPKISGNTASDLMNGRSWIVVDRLHFDSGSPIRLRTSNNIVWQYTEISKRTQACIKAYDDSFNITIQYNKIHDCGGWSTGGCGLGCGSSPNGEAIYIGASQGNDSGDFTRDVVIRGNELYDLPDDAMDIKERTVGALIEDNIIHHGNNGSENNMLGAIVLNKSGSLIPSNVIIRRNVIHSWRAQAQIMSAGNAVVTNNLFYNILEGHGIRIRLGTTGKYYHNTIYGIQESGHTPFAFDSGTSADIRQNIGPTQANNILATSDLFVNAAGGNFQLAADSDARDLGSIFGGVTTDIVGVVRPQGSGVDWGAYELPVGGLAPSAPLNLRLDAQLLDLPTVTVTMAWNASLMGSPTSYTLYWDTVADTYGNSQSAGLALTDDIVGLTPGQTYYFNVTATNASGESVKSNTVVAAPANGDWSPPVIIVMLVKGPSLPRPMVRHIR